MPIIKKFICTAKVACPGCSECQQVKRENGTSFKQCGNDSFKKWHVNNLTKFVTFLDNEHPGWKYFNVFDKKTQAQIGNFTINNRPSQKWLQSH